MKLRHSIPLLMFVVTLVSGAAGLGVLTWQERHALQDNAQLELLARLEAMQASVERAGRRSEPGAVQEAVTDTASNRKNLFAALLAPDGTVISSTRLELIGRRLRAADAPVECRCASQLEELLRAPVRAAPQLASVTDGRVWSGLATAELLRGSAEGNSVLGRVLLVYDAGAEQLGVERELRRHALLVVLLSLIPALLLFPLIRFGVGARILRLLKLTRAIGRGEAVEAGSLEGQDELAELGRGLDAAAAELRARAEQLAGSERDFAEIFEKAPAPLIVTSPARTLLRANAAACALLRRTAEELRGQPASAVVAPESLAELPNQIGRLTSEAKVVTRRPLLDRDGDRIPVEISASALGGGRALLVLRDLRTDLREEARRSQLQHSDRLAALGTLAAGVAHEINNPIAFVRSNLGFALEELRAVKAHADVIEALEEAYTGAERVGQLVADLKQFARAPAKELAPVDLGPLAERTVKLARASTKHATQLVLELGAAPLVRGSEGRLAQVLLNLLVNAAQAMPPHREAENRVVVRTSTEPDGQARIDVEDNGVGIAPEALARLFEPFFTTKPPGQGTGLGLAISREIIEAHHGTLTVQTEPGKGTCFTLRLPPLDDAEV